ncbi:hypothetical protein HU200_048781 [Digitaria exilis]|uniref:Protein kinase domain-containing protein n=1 Tax=Digitaria exilis TaxID=1010633 RepID=A0A835AWZ9_9POAL|nr:hypothetical protein HU200_048781 [Digitaria exilis]
MESPRNPTPRPDCPTMCGDVHIPFPFGIGDDCSWPGLDNFTITCNHSFNPPRPLFYNIEIINISLEVGEMRVFYPLSYICYNSPSTIAPDGVSSWWFQVEGLPYLISPTRNIFTAIGCNTLALLEGREDWSYYTGCITSCTSLHDAAEDGAMCTGLGCCQTPIPANLSFIMVDWNISRDTYNPAWKFSSCSYAFVAEKGWYSFRRRDLTRVANKTFKDRVGDRTIPLVLDWAIRESGAPACVSAHSYCINATQGHGYLCNCSTGYMGNPYVIGGCTKSDPARYEKLYPCYSGSTCHDTEGDYICKCKFGHKGDGKSNKGCQLIFPEYAIAIVGTFVGSVLACFMIMEIKRRKQKKFFDKNGGKILKNMGINIFTEGQLKKITNRYSTPIGEGAFGKVFMGITDAAQRVAVKRSYAKGEALRQEDFVNEITVQFRISHSNLVRLVGCCLETDIPMLVFEFIPNGSLYNVLHGTNRQNVLPLQVRLDIAIGSAEAIAYMHSQCGHVHGDVKSGNILLDEDLTPKVSDFGSSKLVSIATNANWSVAGDMNYIDPVYIKTGRFTEKSDVYSFGVVLLELITRKTAKYEGCRSLPIDFAMSCRDEGRRRGMYDRDILCGDDGRLHVYMECLDRVGELAVRCLKEDVEERPTMAEVVVELKQVKSTAYGGSCSQQAGYATCTVKLSC